MVLATSLYESVYFFHKWRHTALQAAGFERESAVARFESLKQQVDPHFLFNSLNSLAGLVGDNESAQEFLGSLASVYRYVLLSKDHATVPLSQEMAFVDDYLCLTATRFGAAVQVVIHLAPDALRQHVPPLVVQLLIENALKHNAISEKSPLLLTIHAAGDVLSFEIFNAVPVRAPLIFTTSFNEYALKAFQLLSVDYLLKPIQAKDLSWALGKHTYWLSQAPVPPSDSEAQLLKMQQLLAQFAPAMPSYRQRFLATV